MTLSTTPERPLLVGVADEIDAALERHFWPFAGLFAGLLLGINIVRDVWIKMWLDELLTFHMARLANPGEIIKASLERCDGPPLYAIVVHSIMPWVRHDALAVRLPSTLGYCGLFLCIVAFCRHRLPAVYAWAAALMVWQACELYSTEGRSYGLLLGCAAGALLCWQYAADGRHRILAIPLLALCLAMMTALHYYALFFCVPLFVAELVRWRRTGKLDFAMLTAMAPVLVVLGLHYPLIAATKEFQEHYHVRPSWSSILPWYGHYLIQELCVLPLLALALFGRRRSSRSASIRFTLPEWIATGGFTLMPLCVIVLAMFTTHAFIERYVLWAIPGMAVFVAALLCMAARGRTMVGVSLVGLVLALIAIRQVHTFRARIVPSPETESMRRELASLASGVEPIVVADDHVFVELSYYAPPGLRERLIYPLLSRELYLRYYGYDTDAIFMAALGHRTSLPIVDYEQILGAHRRFVLTAYPKDYLAQDLVAAGYRVTPIGSSTPPVLYEVTASDAK